MRTPRRLQRYSVSPSTILRWFPVLLIAAAPVLASETADRLRDTYEKEAARIQAASGEREQKLKKQYGATLLAMEKRLQSKGDLDALIVVQKERKRFEAETSLAEGQVVVSPQELATLQAQFLRAVESLRTELAREVMELVVRYERSLDSLQNQLTRDGDIENALAVKEQKAKARSRPEVTAAEFVLAEALARKPPAPPEPPAPRATEPEPAPVPERTFTVSDKTQLSRRYDDLVDVVLERDWNACMGFIDPDYVEQKGVQHVVNILKLAFPFLQAASIRDVTVKSGSIEVNEDEKTAKVVPKARWNNDWHDLGPTYWRLTDGDWYMVPGGIMPEGAAGDDSGVVPGMEGRGKRTPWPPKKRPRKPGARD